VKILCTFCEVDDRFHTLEQGRRITGAKGGSTPPALEEQEQGGKSVLPMLSNDRNFHIFFLHLFFCKAQSPLLFSNSSPAMKCSTCWKHMFVNSCPQIKILTSLSTAVPFSKLLPTPLPCCCSGVSASGLENLNAISLYKVQNAPPF